MADEAKSNPDAPRVAGHMQKRQRDKAARVAELNKQAHLDAKKRRKAHDQFRASNRGPNPR